MQYIGKIIVSAARYNYYPLQNIQVNWRIKTN